MSGRDEAERRRVQDLLVKKMTTPPFDPENPPLPPPSTYERFSELAAEVRADGDEQIEARNSTAKQIWEAT